MLPSLMCIEASEEYRRHGKASCCIPCPAYGCKDECVRDLSTLGERLAGQRDTFERLVLRAPVSGEAVDMAFHTLGGVVRPGERIMDIVPESDALLV